MAPPESQACQDPLLTEIRFERFKAAFKPDPIFLRPFNVIIGRNGSGKSTLLEALQWLDTTLRHDTQTASDRYYGIKDLVNLRSQANPPYFELQLGWGDEEGKLDWHYRLKVEDRGARAPRSTTFTALHRRGREWSRSLDGESGARSSAVGRRSGRSGGRHDPLPVALGSCATELDHPGATHRRGHPL